MKKLELILQEIYGKNYQDIKKEIYPLLKNSSKRKRPQDWYKCMNLYATYPNSFQTGNKSTLYQLKYKLTYLKKLGIDIIHIFPFYESPMIDGGYDISDFINVRETLGGNKALEELLKSANQKKITILMDMIFNHVSIKHEWFKKAVSGDRKYRNYFLYSKNKPELISHYKDESGCWAEYDFNGKIQKIKIIFPEFAGEIPHYIKAKDGYWYYHTFYPHQIDLDWRNPDVFKEFAKILIYWAKKGMSFRLDAIIFMGKTIEKGILENSPLLHKIIHALHEITKKANPDSVFLVETVQPLKVIRKYFGNKDQIESEIAYSFPLTTQLWKSLLLHNTKGIYNSLKNHYSNMPEWSSWLHFLRNHDALSFEFVSKEDNSKLFSKVINKGLTFCRGFGVAGRTFSFLNCDVERHIMAYTLLASLPGSVQVMYGDEIGKPNDFSFMKKQKLMKQNQMKDKSIVEDTRDINRGILTDSEISTKKSQKIYNSISHILTIRKELKGFFKTVPRFKPNNRLFIASYKLKSKKLITIVNVTDKKQTVNVFKRIHPVLTIGKTKVYPKLLQLSKYSSIWFIE